MFRSKVGNSARKLTDWLFPRLFLSIFFFPFDSLAVLHIDSLTELNQLFASLQHKRFDATYDGGTIDTMYCAVSSPFAPNRRLSLRIVAFRSAKVANHDATFAERKATLASQFLYALRVKRPFSVESAQFCQKMIRSS